MATIYNDDFVDIDLNNGTITRGFANRAIGYADKNGNRYGVKVNRAGQPVQLTDCTCTGFFIRHADGATIPIVGEIDNNVGFVILPAACYALEGSFSLAIKINSSDSNVKGTKRIVDGTVVMTDTGTYVDPGTILPNIQTLLDAIEAAEQSLPSDWAGLNYSLQLAGMREEKTIPAGMYTETNAILGPAGTTLVFEGWATTPYIPILDQDMYFKGGFFPADAYNNFCLYDASFTLIAGIKGNKLIKASDYPTARYFRASTEGDAYYTIVGNQRSFDYIARTIGTFTSNQPEKLGNEYYYEQGILSSDGTTVDDSFATAHDYNTTPFIEIVGKDLYFTGGFFTADGYNTFVLYNANKEMIARGTGTQTIALKDYPTAKYFRASSNYRVGDDFYVMISNGASVSGREIHIGSGYEYTTLRAGIAEAIKYPNSKVIVHPGTYNLATEFADVIQSQPSGLQGLYLTNNVHVIFMAGSYVKALFPTTNNWINTYFNPIFGRDFILEGIRIEASNCRYIVHDEQSGADVNYHNVYLNCQMKMTAVSPNGTYCQCIGGGLGKNGYIEIIGGKYESYGEDGSGESPAISYHNGSVANADSKFFIRDVYLDGDGGNFRFGYYGPSTIKSPVYINGCSMKSAILKRAETSGSTNDNFEIIEWNNIVRG